MYEKMNVATLKATCKERGIKGYSRLVKAGLLEALEKWDRENAPKPEAAPIVESAPGMRFTKYPNTTARNRAKRRRRAIRASGGMAA